jgi:hypothetical protein
LLKREKIFLSDNQKKKNYYKLYAFEMDGKKKVFANKKL